MNDLKTKRAVKLGEYIAANACTVRAAAEFFDLGKSTVHKDVTERLPKVEPELYERVRRILDYNLSVRHIRGGEATKLKCAKNK
ncbi:MAG: stage III sporulation protein D [Clostridia bacterium]|jgi:putative DeoR family transcriptional regulator (stage III sporulation protein D)|nr:stage III sporulation protein D [Clostridia bacterium]MCI9459720.1 stage III sporulation protein D [Clostridia bacterium]